VSPVVGVPKPRPSWDEYGMLLAFAVAERADCTRRKVGAVVMGPDHRIHGTGYNGAPPGVPGCASADACPRGRLGYDQVPASSNYSKGAGACAAKHAEWNAVDWVEPQFRTGATVFVTDEPCPDCTSYLAASGVARVVWPDGEFSYPIG
jgi:dCMP deaminase